MATESLRNPAPTEDVSPADRELLEEALLDLAGPAFAQLHRRYTPRLLAYFANRMSRNALLEPGDLVNEVWLRAARHLKRAQGELFRSWLLTIAERVLFDFFRRERVRRIVKSQEDLRDKPDEAHVPPWEQLVDEERRAVLQQCLEKLTESLRSVMTSRLGGQSYEEISQELGISTAVAQQRSHRALEDLKTCVGRSSV